MQGRLEAGLATWASSASLSEQAFAQALAGMSDVDKLLDKAIGESWLSLVEDSDGHIKFVHWRPKAGPMIGIPVEITKQGKHVFYPEVTIKHQKLEQDFSGASIVHPLLVKYHKTKAFRDDIPEWARRLKRMWELCVDVRSSAERQGIFCSLCETSVSVASKAAKDDWLDQCVNCTLSFHRDCAADLATYVKRKLSSGVPGSASASSSSAAPPAAALPDLPSVGSATPPAELTKQEWAHSLCAVCRLRVA